MPSFRECLEKIEHYIDRWEVSAKTAANSEAEFKGYEASKKKALMSMVILPSLQKLKLGQARNGLKNI